MTRPSKPGLRQLRNRRLQSFRLGVVLGGIFTTVAVMAQVKLENSVQKMETYFDAAGEEAHRFVEANNVVSGDELRYTISLTNEGVEIVDAGSIVITNPLPPDTQYVAGTAAGAGTQILYSLDDEMFASAEELQVTRGGVRVTAGAADYRSIRWVYQQELGPGESSSVFFNLVLTAPPAQDPPVDSR